MHLGNLLISKILALKERGGDVADVPNFDKRITAARGKSILRRGRKLGSILYSLVAVQMMGWELGWAPHIPKRSLALVITRDEDAVMEFIIAHILHFLCVERVECGERFQSVVLAVLVVDVPQRYFPCIASREDVPLSVSIPLESIAL